MNNDDLLTILLNETTIVKIVDNATDTIFSEKPTETDFDPHSLQYREIFNFSILDTFWENKWSSFGDQWTHERQLFRFLWYEANAFVKSYQLYKENFASALNLSFETSDELQNRRRQHDLGAELGIRSTYEYGKQTIKLLRELSQHNQSINTIISDPTKADYLDKFVETRNKFLIHYHDPRRFRDLVFDPSFISVMGTGSLFEVDIHIQNQEEKRYSVYINHYADYFKLEEILVEIIRQF